MRSAVLSASVLILSAAVGCASNEQVEREPEVPPTLHIEDQSADAPPTAPPSAPPADADAAPAPEVAPPSAPPQAIASPQPPPAPAAVAPAPPPPSTVIEAPPSSTTWTYEYPTGRWVYANGYGWMWVPANAAVSDNDGVPYTYLYTPRYGWTWYVSPWGPGPYRYGVWVRRPWHPVGWRGGFVAHSRVVVRLGGGPRYDHHYGARHRRW
jgi:hypothetical protein